jgi:hypothetical protein
MADRSRSSNEINRRLADAEEALKESWLSPEGLSRVAVHLGSLLPGTVGLVYFRDQDGGYGPTALALGGPVHTTWDAFPVPASARRLSMVLGHPMRGPYEWAGRFVETTSSYAVRRDELHGYQELLGEAGLRHHARAVFYRGGVMRAWYGVFGSRGDPEFSRPEIAILSRLAPAIRDAVRAGDITRYGRVEPVALQGILELVDQPVWLLVRRGFVAHANAAARTLGRDARIAATRAAMRRDGDARFAISRVSIAGEPIWVVIGRHVEPIPLPPSLARVASALVRGLTDKEIADELGIPTVTVRTYVQRIYRRLGVRNRVELARAMQGQPRRP